MDSVRYAGGVMFWTSTLKLRLAVLACTHDVLTTNTGLIDIEHNLYIKVNDSQASAAEAAFFYFLSGFR